MILSDLRDKLRNMKPSNILLLSFLFVILLGTFLLLLPFAHKNELTFIDSLFTCVSSTCVTGLLTINVLNDLTLFGQIVVLVMIQIGGLGLMSFIALMFRFRKEKLAYAERKYIKDSFNKYDDQDVSGYLYSIFIYTFVTEFISFILICTQLFNGSAYSIFQSLFLSISSFCNAGIENLSTCSLIPYQSNVLINVVVTAEIILGGIGFIVWDDIKNNVKEYIKNKYSFSDCVSKLKVHTKLVLAMTFTLLISATAITFVLEYNVSLKGLNTFDKLLGSYFSAVTLRTAGFYTIDFSRLSRATRLIMCLYMLVGGSPGGTAGGFKTTTLFLIVFGVKSAVMGKDYMHVLNRHIHKSNYIKASTIIFLYVSLIFLGMIVLCTSENKDFLDLLFEACSALGTVGLTVGLTPSLTSIGKIVIMILMFVGRVGPTTLIISLMNKVEKDFNIKYPTEEIIVG